MSEGAPFKKDYAPIIDIKDAQQLLKDHAFRIYISHIRIRFRAQWFNTRPIVDIGNFRIPLLSPS